MKIVFEGLGGHSTNHEAPEVIRGAHGGSVIPPPLCIIVNRAY